MSDLRPRIHPQLQAWYDASPGFDFDHLEDFVARCNAQELENLKEDPRPGRGPGGEIAHL